MTYGQFSRILAVVMNAHPEIYHQHLTIEDELEDECLCAVIKFAGKEHLLDQFHPVICYTAEDYDMTDADVDAYVDAVLTD